MFTLINEENYSTCMNETVIPSLESRRKSGTFERKENEPIYYECYDADDPKAVVVIVHGFSSSVPKFYECAWYFLQNGFSVRMLEQRGHGRSFRGIDDPAKVYIKDYRDLVRDLHFFVKNVVQPDIPSDLPLYLYAHSMGGGVGACFLEHYPDIFKKAVLNAPMLEMHSGDTPLFAAYLLAAAKIRLGKGQEGMPGSAPFSGVPDFENSPTTCRARYDWFFEYQKQHEEFRMCIPTFETAMQFLRLTQDAGRKELFPRVKAEVLLFQAENDTFVKPGGQNRFIEGIPHGKLIRVPGSKHEIYRSENSILEGYWKEILQFF